MTWQLPARRPPGGVATFQQQGAAIEILRGNRTPHIVFKQF
jgi:hypothetical protein